MKTNRIPKSNAALISLAARVVGGAQFVGETAGLLQNTAAAIEADLIRFAGYRPNSGGPSGDGGAEQALCEAVGHLGVAHAWKRQALTAAREFCAMSIGVLKNSLGRRWNSDWVVAGFTRGSLAVPADPLLLLTDLRSFLTIHPEQAVAQLGFTVAEAQARINELCEASAEVGRAKSLRVEAKKARDAARARLKRRLSGVRMELTQLLEPNDPQWLVFGFRPPGKVQRPAPVKAVTVAPSTPGNLLVQWTPGARAESYRVTKQVTGVDPEPVDLGLRGDPQMMISDLPEGAEVTIGVSGHNSAGDSRAIAVVVQMPLVGSGLSQAPVSPALAPAFAGVDI